MAAAEEDAHRVADAVAATLRLRATTPMAMRLQVAAAVVDVVAVAPGEVAVAVVALRSDEDEMSILEEPRRTMACITGLGAIALVRHVTFDTHVLLS